MTEYAEQRRQYVSQVRRSFECDAGDMPQERQGTAGLWMRLRILMAAGLLIGFFCWQSSGVTIQGITSGKVIDMIADNRYDTILQDYILKK